MKALKLILLGILTLELVSSEGVALGHNPLSSRDLHSVSFFDLTADGTLLTRGFPDPLKTLLRDRREDGGWGDRRGRLKDACEDRWDDCRDFARDKNHSRRSHRWDSAYKNRRWKNERNERFRNNRFPFPLFR